MSRNAANVGRWGEEESQVEWTKVISIFSLALYARHVAGAYSPVTTSHIAYLCALLRILAFVGFGADTDLRRVCDGT